MRASLGLTLVSILCPDGSVETTAHWANVEGSADSAHVEALLTFDSMKPGASLAATAALLSAEFTAKGTPRKATERARLRYYAADDRFMNERRARHDAYLATLSATAGVNG